MGYLFCASVNQEKCTNSRDQTYHLLYSFSRTVCDEVQSNRTLSFYFFFFYSHHSALKSSNPCHAKDTMVMRLLKQNCIILEIKRGGEGAIEKLLKRGVMSLSQHLKK